MKPNEVHRTETGVAYYSFTKDNGQKMYLIEFVNGKHLFTYSMDIVRDELSKGINTKTTDNTQLNLFL